MPSGLLIFCLDYAAKTADPLPGIFTSVRNRFSDLANDGPKHLLHEFYEFRNTYFTHEKKELTDLPTTRKALNVWVATLQALYAA